MLGPVDLTELAEDASRLVAEALPTFAARTVEPLDAEAFAVLLGLPWTMGDVRPAATQVLLAPLERAGGPDAVDVLNAIADLFPQARDAATAAAGRLGGEGRRGDRATFGYEPVGLLDVDGTEVLGGVVTIGEDLGVASYITLEHEDPLAGLGGGLRGDPVARDAARRSIETLIEGFGGDGATIARPSLEESRAHARRLFATAAEQGWGQRESLALERPILARALGEDLRDWPVLPMLPSEDLDAAAVTPPPAPPRARGASDRRAKRSQAKAARRRNRR